MVISIFHLVPLGEIWQNRDLKLFIRLNYNILDGLLLYSAYWFITTYLISMTLFVVLRKHAESTWLGLVLASVTAFYCVNLYAEWIESNHSKAVLGYAIFIYAGMKINKHFDAVMSWISRTPWLLMSVFLVSSFALACVEGSYLETIKSADPYASNRISNILLSFVFFFFLLKLGEINSINKLNPRKNVYGMFLIHNILIFEFSRVLTLNFSNHIDTVSVWVLLIYQLVFFVSIVILTYIVVDKLSGSRFKWMIGLRNSS